MFSTEKYQELVATRIKDNENNTRIKFHGKNRKCTTYEKRSPDSSNDHSGDQEGKVSRNLRGLATLQTVGPLIFAIFPPRRILNCVANKIIVI